MGYIEKTLSILRNCIRGWVQIHDFFHPRQKAILFQWYACPEVSISTGTGTGTVGIPWNPVGVPNPKGYPCVFRPARAGGLPKPPDPFKSMTKI